MKVDDLFLAIKTFNITSHFKRNMVGRDRDRSRVAESDRELPETRYKEDGFLRCCGSCPFASLLAFVLTVTGTGLFCGCLYYPLRMSIEHINNVFAIEYIDYEWIRVVRLSVIFIPVIMGSIALMLLIIGAIATGTTRHKVFTGFRSRLCGRIATGFFTVIVYLLLLLWLLIVISMVVPCIALYVLKYRCTETWSRPTASGWPDTAAPIACLTPGTYGIPPPRLRPDAKVCQQKFNELCALTEHSPRFWTALGGSILVVLGLIHFLCCLVANYTHIKAGRKLHDYEEVIQEELEISKHNQH